LPLFLLCVGGAGADSKAAAKERLKRLERRRTRLLWARENLLTQENHTSNGNSVRHGKPTNPSSRKGASVNYTSWSKQQDKRWQQDEWANQDESTSMISSRTDGIPGNLVGEPEALAQHMIAVKNLKIAHLEKRVKELQDNLKDATAVSLLDVSPSNTSPSKMSSSARIQAALFDHLIREEDKLEKLETKGVATPAVSNTDDEFPGHGSWLYKQGQRAGSWKLRWFVLREARPGRWFLVFFSSTDESQPPKGLMSLKKASVLPGGYVATSLNPTTPEEGALWLLTLRDAPGDEFLLRCDTMKVRDLWLSKLQRAVAQSS